MSRAHDAPIDPAIVEQASEWLMLHWGGDLDAPQRQAFVQWQQAHPEHQRAWQRLQQLQQTFGSVPAGCARAVLRDSPDPQRRAALKMLGLLLVAGGSGYLLQDQVTWRATFAEHRTATGEIRHLTLSDGTRLDLNSDSAVDLRFTAQERRIKLLRGEVLLTSGHDPVRPLIVETASGDVQALGTRFSVREMDDGARVELYEGQLRISPRQGAPVLMEAGHALWFSASGVGPLQTANVNASSWSQGRLIAERQPLGRFLAELARYRPGWIRCDESVSSLLLTGVFPLDNTDAVLAALERTLPVQVESVTRYWVTVKRRA
ncbi:FecR domain-containing protein [Pseudomonas sp. MYb118]|uniref:FecR domain-containing protein n=1 Tax=Pseudomonas sp. MYb118 TaxID=1848720 RepID=UPI0034CFE343